MPRVFTTGRGAAIAGLSTRARRSSIAVPFKHLAAVVLIVLIAGCAGGGGCGGCAMTPLPSGFKTEDRVENAGSVRLTESGLEFLEQNLGVLARALLGGGDAGVLTFGIPSISGSALVDYTVCPGGPDSSATPPKCTAEIDLGSAALQIEPTGPHNLRIRGPLPLRLQSLPILVDYGFLGEDTPIATLNSDGGCPPDAQGFTNIDLGVELSIEIDVNQTHSRHGYSRLKIVSLTVDEDQISSSLHLDCGDSVTGEILNFLKPIILPLIIDSLVDTLAAQLDQQLCQQANPAVDPPCPEGTNDIEGTCRYGSRAEDECASLLLGIEGHVDLGQLLAGISPGTKGGVDLLLAGGGEGARGDSSGFKWGDLNPVANGVTLGLYGGAEPLPVSKCVPLSDIALPQAIPIPDELLANTVADWPAEIPGPHVGIAISERFANYALNGMYSSGLLCLGISTESVALLNSGTLGLLAKSSKNLTIQQETQQIALTVRPQKPPQVTFGNGTNIDTDPMIRVKLEQATIDFYVWSLDRFVRFMTATFDLDIPLNLSVTPDGLVPVLKTIGVSNGKVTNSALLTERPEAIASALGGLISSQVGQLLGGGIPAVDLNGALASFGLRLQIPDSVDGKGSPGLRRLTKDHDGVQDNYLGIFATLEATAPQAARSETRAELRSKQVQPEGLRLPTMTSDNGPTARLVMSSPLDDGARAIEYSYRIDRGVWRPFTRERIVDVRDDWLRLQARHVISVRSRIAGDPMSLDPTPASVEMVVDVDPPRISVGAERDGKVTIEVRDAVSGADQAKVRVRLDGAAWSPWTAVAALGPVEVGDADDIEVEATDEEGNLGTARQAIIRGRIPTDGSGCGCAVVGARTSTSPAGAWLLPVAVFALGVRLARRRVRPSSEGVARAPRAPAAGRRPLARAARGAAAAIAVIAWTGSHAGCSCGDDPEVSPRCGADCVSLEYGLIGAYTSVAVDKDTIWIAGYAEADWNSGNQWGDLAVGRWNGEAIDWQAVDGVPAEPAVDPTKFDVNGFRGGQTEPGEDVGTWTSIAIGPDGEPAVAYHDRTNRSLKLAQRQGGAWAISVVQRAENSDLGRYAKLLFVKGVPVIAYLAIEPGEGGAVTSSVRLATGANAAPGEGEFRFEDVVSDKATPCREFICASGTKCLKTTGRCTEPLDSKRCDPACNGASACVDGDGGPACAEVFDGSRLDTYPDAVGDYIAMVPDGKDGVGLAFYDRIHGNLVIASKVNGKWQPLVVDGATPDGVDTGDVGIGASLFIDDAGDWHLAYADGLSEGLRYARVRGGTEAVTPELADDGLAIAGAPFEDGQHIVGDDAKIFVTKSGDVHLTYQDATSGTLRHAVGTVSGEAHRWQVKAIEQKGFAGAFSQIIEVEGRLLIANWWRVGGQEIRGDVAIVAP